MAIRKSAALRKPAARATKLPALRSLLLLPTLALALFPGLFPTPSPAQLHALETANLRLVYEKTTQSYLAPHAARCFENSLRFHRTLFDYDPTEKITVILNDFSDYGHGAATATPRNALLLSIAPMSSAFETYPANERMFTLMNHELVHVAALDRASGSDRFFRALFRGKVSPAADHPESIVYGYLTTPRRAAPRWYHEGLAVFVETWMAGGYGRAQGAYDEMVFRSMVRDEARFYDPLGLASEGSKTAFQGGATSYLYGTRFLSYLAHAYSPDSLVRWASRGPGTSSYYAGQFRRVYGKSLDAAWRDWMDWEREFQATNLESVRTYCTTPYRDVSRRALGSVSRAYLDRAGERLFVAVNYPGTVAHIAAVSIEDGSLERICDVKGAQGHTVTSLAYDEASSLLFYTADNYDWRDLRVVDPETRESRTLLREARIGDLAFCPADRSLWGVRHYNGISTLVRVPHPYESWDQIHSWPYGQGISDLDVSTDGRLVSVSFSETTGDQSLRVFSVERLEEGDTTPVVTYEFGSSIPSSFVFLPGGRSLVGSSYYTGVSNIFRCRVDADSMEALSNAETGFFRPLPVSADSLLVFRYTGEGFVPSMIEARPLEDVSAITFLGQQVAEKHPAVTKWSVGSPAAVNLDSLTTCSGPYRGLPNVGLESVYPVVEGYKVYPAYGLHVALSDPVYLHRFHLTASYSPAADLPDDERYHLELGYRRHDWTASFTVNDADFYDLFGPTRTSRRGVSIGLSHRRELLYDDPKSLELAVGVTGYANLERVPDYQNVATSFKELVTAHARLAFRNEKFSIGAVDYEKGVKADAIATGNHVNGELFANLSAGLDLGAPLLFRYSSLWLRMSAGHSLGDRENPFANFFFGGFGNNWVDHRDPKRYRASHSFPGIGINEVGGKNYGKALLDWNLPPLRFRHLGKPALYATWLRFSLFGGGIMTNLDHAPRRRELLNSGVQADLRLTLLSNLNLTFSTGWAAAFEEGRKPTDEWMFSLKIL